MAWKWSLWNISDTRGMSGCGWRLDGEMQGAEFMFPGQGKCLSLAAFCSLAWLALSP